MEINLKELANKLNAEFYGDESFLVKGISSIDHPIERTVIFVFEEKYLPTHYLFNNIYIVNSILKKKVTKKGNFIFVHSPKLVFSRLSKKFIKDKSRPKQLKISDNSDSPYHNDNLFIGNRVKYGKNCSFGLNVCIEDGVQIGNNVIIGHNVIIGSNCVIGDNVVIDSGTVIGSEGFGNTLDEKGKWHHIQHLGKVIIKDNVLIGSNCCIDRGTIEDTIIFSGVIIDNLVHIAHNVHIGENSAIAAKVGIAGSCNIGKRNMIGGMVGIVDHINTTDDVIISAASTVNKDIKEPGTYTGIMPISNHVTWKRIALWITKLDKIAKFLNLKKSKL